MIANGSGIEISSWDTVYVMPVYRGGCWKVFSGYSVFLPTTSSLSSFSEKSLLGGITFLSNNKIN